MKIAVIGAGISGILCAYYLSGQAQVTVFEKGNHPGGLCSEIDFYGTNIEKYYHFFSRSDAAVIRLISELKIKDALHWEKVNQASIKNGKLAKMNNSFSLLVASGLTMFEKIRFALFLIRMRYGDGLQFNQKVLELAQKDISPKAFENYLKPLLEFKFKDFGDVSASYLWARIREEKYNEIGYLRGGLQMLINRLLEEIKEKTGEIVLNREITSLKKLSNKKWQINNEGHRQYDYVISCISAGDTLSIYPELASKAEYNFDFSMLNYLHIGSFILKIKSPLKSGYWLFITELEDKSQQIIIDASVVLKNNLIYCPTYNRSGFFSQSEKEYIFKNCLQGLKKINPKFEEGWIENRIFCQDRQVEPLLTTEFITGLYKVKDSFEGLYIPELTYEKHLLKTINTLTIKAQIIAQRIRNANESDNTG